MADDVYTNTDTRHRLSPERLVNNLRAEIVPQESIKVDWRGFSANEHTPGVAIQSLWLWLGCCAFRQRNEERKLIAGGWSGGFQIYSYLFPFCSSTKNIIQQVPFLSFFLFFLRRCSLSQMRKHSMWRKTCEMKIPFRYQTSFITGRRVTLGFW